MIFCHVHYLDVWNEIAARIAQTFDQPFRLVVTTAGPVDAVEAPATPHLLAMRVVGVENRGRDVRPFLQVLREEPAFDVGLKLHTKRSVHRLDGEGWRQAITGSLLPDREGTRRIAALLGSKTGRLGIVAPDGALLSVAFWMGRNRRPVAQVARRMGRDPRRLFAHCPYFVAGSMFWFRAEALAPFRDVDLDDLFAGEKGQTDGTAAHAVERLFAPVAEAEGWITASAAAAAGLGEEPVSDAALRSATLAEMDADSRFLRRPHPLVMWASNRLPFVVSAYRAMPDPMRVHIRDALHWAAGVARRSKKPSRHGDPHRGG